MYKKSTDSGYFFFLPFNGRYFETPMASIPNIPKNIGKVLSPMKFPMSKIAATIMKIIPV